MAELPKLGRLNNVILRDLWPDEARSFTPWLAQPENLALLGDALGIDLELVRTEREVGSFYADIVCRDTADGSHVLIENQLEKTDHTHLGQILTYAAGLDAVTIVWIARQFNDAHRAALDWLNEHTVERVQFFGLEIEAYRIGDSAPAPKFQVVARPNDWSRQAPIRAADERTETQDRYLRFWMGFREYCEGRDVPFRVIKPLPQNWMSLSIGKTGFSLTAAASTWDSARGAYGTGEIRAEFVVQDARREFGPFQEQRAAIERELGPAIRWDDSEEKKSAKVYFLTEASMQDEGQWQNYYAWLVDHLSKLHRVFADRVRSLPKA